MNFEKEPFISLYQKAIKKWGKPLQIIVSIEEFSELTKELCKIIRLMTKKPPIDEIDLKHLIEEICDCEIMITQLKVMFDIFKEVKNNKIEKFLRLKESVGE